VLRHIVLLRFREDADPGQVEALVTDFLGIEDQVPGIESLALHRDIGLNPINAHVMLELEFADPTAWRSYQDHPVHQDFVHNRVAPILEERAVIQVEAG